MRRPVFITGIISLLMFTVPAWADEGMWTFNNPPKDLLKARYKFDATDAWLEHVRLASVRFNNGGSGAFFSPHRPVMTNPHVRAGFPPKGSTPEKDPFPRGRYAKTSRGEIKSPGLEVKVPTRIRNV